ncbi:MAG: OmpA family protein, partial [Verrucomicrobiota bacterium]
AKVEIAALEVVPLKEIVKPQRTKTTGSEMDLDYLGPVDGPETTETKSMEVAYVGPKEEPAAHGVSSEKRSDLAEEAGRETEPMPLPEIAATESSEAADKPPVVAAEPNRKESTEVKPAGSGPVPDDGKPIIFYFDTGSAEIADDDWEKVRRAVQRASRPRTIVYITGYADYRGSFELNHKLTLERANNVKDAIFAANLPDTVTAEISAKADEQSEKRDPGRKDDDQSLRYNRRVVVEVYHLKG